MKTNTIVLQDIIAESKDGEWGKGEAFDSSVEMIVVRSTDFEDVQSGRIDGVPRRFIPPAIAARKKMQCGDIIIETAGGGKDRPTGRTQLLRDNFVMQADLPITCASFCRFLRIDSTKAHPPYIYWHLQYLYVAGVMKQFHTQHTGVARFQYTTFATTQRFDVPASRITQRKIAGVLSAYDDLIENNTRRIAILEEMAQSIYREWFVNFRFPGHENVKLVDSPLGKIPEGWKVVQVQDAIFINPRVTVPKDGEKPFVAMAALPHKSMLIDLNAVELRTGNSGSKFQNGDTLFARITPCLENGKTAFVQFLGSSEEVAFGSTEFIVLRSKSVCPEFVYLLARSDSFRDNAIKSMSGATGRQRVQERCFDAFLLAHPDSKTVSAFSDAMQPLFRFVRTLDAKNRNLRATRDLLLPKLISGQLDVDELDIDVGESLVRSGQNT